MRAQGKFYQPDHWTYYQFPAGKAQAPVCGVRPEDAQAFCRWLTQYESKGKRYRLPTSEEAKQYSLSKEMTAAWCRDVGEFKIVGLENQEKKLRNKLEPILNEFNPSLAILDFNSTFEIESSSNFFSYLRALLISK